MRLAVTLLFLILLAVPSPAKIVDYIVAVVNGEPILYSELIAYAKRSGIRDLRKARDSLIERKILVTEALKEGLKVSESELERAFKNFLKENGFESESAFKDFARREGFTVRDVKEELRSQLLIARLVNRKVKSKIEVSDLEVEKACKSLESDVMREVYYVLVRDKDKALKVMDALKAGADFGEIARKYSEDPATAGRGGYLGKVKRGTLIKELDDAVWSTEPGSFKLVRSKDAYFIVYVKSEEKRKCDREEVRQRLFMEKFEKALNDYIEELKKKASVKVYL